MRRFLVICLLLLVLAPAAVAQVERYEVGQRLVRLDRAWDERRKDEAAKKRALKSLLPVVPSFFAGQWPNAARLLDKARRELGSGAEAPAEVRWAESLSIEPVTRLLDRKADRLVVNVGAFYKSEVKIPDKAQLVLGFRGGKALPKPVTTPLKELPYVISLPATLPAGDHWLEARVDVNGKMLMTEELLISVVDRPLERVQAVRTGLADLGDKVKTTDGQTISYLAALVENLARRVTFETNYPADRLLGEAEAALAALKAGKSYFGGDKTGQFWLKLATAKGNFYSRLFAPDAVKKNNPLPLVIALHGAGASENLFFEGYGNGLTVKMCQERGWLLVSPRTNGYLAFTMPVGAIVDEVAKLYAVDRSRVFVVGHSMGAAQALSAAQEQPKLFAAAAFLSGNGKLFAAEKIKKMPLLIGVGGDDITLESTRKLAKQLEAAGASALTFKEYPDVEHIMIVREALPDCFALFDKAARK